MSKAHFRSLAGAIVGTLGLVATAVVVAFQSGPGAPRLAVKDVKTNDRCVVYTYRQDQGMGDATGRWRRGRRFGAARGGRPWS